LRRTFLQRLRFGLTAILVAALVLLAVSMSLLRLAVAFAPELRGQVELVLTQALQRPLTLGGMRAAWAGRHPRLILEDVRLTGGPLAGLEIPELEVDIDLLRSLGEMRLHLAQVEVSGLVVQATYAADGGLRVTRVGNADLEQELPGGSTPKLPALVQLRNTTVRLTDLPSGKTFSLSPVALDLDNRGGSYNLAGYVPLPEALGGSLRFRAEWQGLDPAALTGRLYVDAWRLHLESLSGLLGRVVPVPALRGFADAELWAEIEAGSVMQAGGRLTLADVALPGDASRWRKVAEQLRGEFRWQRQAAGWELAVDRLSVRSSARAWPASALSLQFRQADTGKHLDLAGSYLHLGDLATAATLLPTLPVELRQRLEEAGPTAALQGPRLALRWSAEGLEDFKFYSRFSEGGLRPAAGWPGARGLAGELWVGRDGGRLRLDSQTGELRFAELFRGPLPFHSLQGEAFWRIGADGWILEAPELAVANRDGRARARLRLIGDGQGSPFIDLRAQLLDGNAAGTSRYLPVTKMPASVVGWLDAAGFRGRIPQADLVLFGRTKNFPFADGSGVFDVQAKVSNLRLAYRQDWPALYGVDGRLRFFANSMEAQVERGRIAGAGIQRAQVRIDQLGKAPLVFAGEARGSGDQLLGFLRDSPLGNSIREQLTGMQLSGTHGVSVRAAVPLRPGEQAEVEGEVRLERGSYSVPRWGLQLDALEGTVRFTEQGLAAEQVTARYRGLPAVLSAQTTGGGADERIAILAQLQAAPRQLLDGLASPWLHGRTDWEVQLLLPGFQAPRPAGTPAVELRVASQLEGIVVELPAPLGKSAAEARALRLSVPFAASGPGPVRLAYGDEVRALLGLATDGMAVARAGIVLGAGEPVLPREGVVVRGALESLDLSGWRLPAGGAVTAGGSLSLTLADVHIGRLQVMGQTFADTTVRVQPDSGGWVVGLEGPDVAGGILLPAGPFRTVTARLDHLRLQPPPMNGARDKADSAAGADSGGLPALDIVAAEFFLRDQALGRMELLTRAADGETTIERAWLSGPLLDFKASGGWTRKTGRSQLVMQLHGNDAGRLLNALGYADAMRGGKISGSLDVSWEGRILEFSLAELTGRLDLRLTDGQILTVEPGAGRLFGLLSIAELPRRLSLNFSDLFGKGFAYDRIVAQLELADGDAYTRRFYMEGTAARVELDGRIGLAARDYDQRVTVIPKVSNTLPAIGAVTAGPVGIVAGLVTQKLLEKEINKLTRYRYRVAGSWDAPHIEPMATADAVEQTEPLAQEGTP